MRKRLSLQSLSVMSLALILIAFGQGIAYYAISGMMLIFNVKLQVPDVVFWLKNMPYFGLVPQLVGAAILGVYIFESKFQDLSLVKKQLLRVSVLVLTVVMVAGCAFTAVPMVNAQMISTSGYYLQTPLPIASMYVGKYTNASWFCINGSNWQNFAQGPNSTLIESYALGNTSSGAVWMQDAVFNYSLHIPQNVSVVENLNGLSRTFCNVTNSQGAPYTISIDNVTSGYYLAHDSADEFINDWSSTNASTVMNTAVDYSTVGEEVDVSSGTYYMDGSVQLINSTAFIGDGRNNTILFATRNITLITTAYLGVVDQRYITVKGFTLDGNWTASTLLDFQSALPIVEDLQMRRSAESAGAATFAMHVRARNAGGTQMINAKNLYFEQTGSGALFVDDSDGCYDTIQVNSCGYTGGVINVTDGIVVSGGNNKFVQVHVFYAKNGMNIWSGGKQTLVTDSDFENNAQHGLEVGSATDVSISISSFHRNGYATPNTYSDIYLYEADRTKVDACTFLDTESRTKYNIEEYLTNQLVATGNTYNHPSTAAFYIDGNDTVISGGGIYNSTNMGVYIKNAACTNTSITTLAFDLVPIPVVNNGVGTKVSSCPGFVTQNSGSTASVVNGTWILDGLAGQATSISLTPRTIIAPDGGTYQIGVIARNSTAFQVGLYEVSKDLVYGVTPGFGAFNTTGTNPARITDNDFTTTTGLFNTTCDANGIIGYVYFDMGAALPAEINMRFEVYRANNTVGTIGFSIDTSSDNNSWVYGATITSGWSTSQSFYNLPTRFLCDRYFRLDITSASVSGETQFISYFTEIQALCTQAQAVTTGGIPVDWQTEHAI